MAENNNSNDALREALDGVTGILEEILDAFERGTGGVLKSDIREAIKNARAALAKPQRNCDVGSAEEQKYRFKEYCDRHFDKIKDGCKECPARDHINGWGVPYCQLKWEQMPYDKQSNNRNKEEQSK